MAWTGALSFASTRRALIKLRVFMAKLCVVVKNKNSFYTLLTFDGKEDSMNIILAVWERSLVILFNARNAFLH
jgi:hypothetical protein